MSLRPLGRVLTILEHLGLEATYIYDDLVFVQHGALLLQFSESAEELNLYINEECDPEEAERDTQRLTEAFSETDLGLAVQGRCRFTSNENNTISIQFS